MNWKPILPSIVSSYKNGNHTVTIYSDGTKIKETIDPNADHFTYYTPESFDLKITDYCDGGCCYCAENSTINGKHADLSKINDLMGKCKEGTEVAIGGGNALAHPNIVTFVYYLRSLGLIPSITVNQAHLKPYYEVLMNVKKARIAGIGISLTDPNNFEDFRIIDKFGHIELCVNLNIFVYAEGIGACADEHIGSNKAAVGNDVACCGGGDLGNVIVCGNDLDLVGIGHYVDVCVGLTILCEGFGILAGVAHLIRNDLPSIGHLHLNGKRMVEDGLGERKSVARHRVHIDLDEKSVLISVRADGRILPLS